MRVGSASRVIPSGSWGRWPVAAYVIGEAVLGGRRGRRAAQRGVLSVGATSVLLGGLRRFRTLPDAAVDRATASALVTATAMEHPLAAAPLAGVVTLEWLRSAGRPHPHDGVLTGFAGMAIGAGVAVATARIWPRISPEPAETHPVPAFLQAEPSPTGRGMVLVSNGAAGRSRHRGALDQITGALPDIEVVEVDDPGQIGKTFATAARRATVLGVLGGDGTIGAAAAAAIDDGVPLAVFPGGTLNHFGRDVGVDTIDDAIHAVTDGELVEVDTAIIDGRLFVNTASFGGYSEFVQAREDYEDRVGKWPAAALALLKLLTTGAPVGATINGEQVRVWMIFIGNCAYHPPGFAPATRERLDDGLLDVRLVDGSKPGAKMRLLAAVATGQLARSRVYTRRLVSRLEISTADDHPVLAADGETFDGNATFTVAKNQDRLRIFAPHR